MLPEARRKAQFTGFVFTPKKATLITGAAFGPNGEIQLLSGDEVVPMADIRPTEWRQTPKGLKVKSQTFSGDTAYVNPEAALGRSDHVFGVDTNTVTKGGNTVHVSCLTCATRQIVPEGFEGSIQQIMCIDFEDAAYPPERIGWLFAVEAIMRSMPAPDADIVLFTDHDLNALPAINKREAPFIADRYLPSGFQMSYASDKGTAIPNKVIKAAHKGASKVAGNFLEQDLPSQRILPYLLKEPLAMSIRQWRNDTNSQFYFG